MASRFLNLAQKRRSMRRFKNRAILPSLVKNILEAGRFAPSGLNNQPWRFLVLSGEEKNSLACFTQCNTIIKSADKIILVFLDQKISYNKEKDLMAIGACIQNMLLAATAQELGSCWLGEILNQRTALQKFLKIPAHLRLEAVVALGYPAQKLAKSRRKPLNKLVIGGE
jgi:nitroreductase